MNKISQNKITFTLILFAITIIFSSLLVLSLPVLFKYKSKVLEIENNYYKSFKVYLNSSGKISYKPFPKPHLLLENASLSFSKPTLKNDLINTTDLKIFVPLRDIYFRSFNQFNSTEISDTNLYLKMHDIKQLRKHMYEKVNKPILLNNCKIFIKNKENDIILISPLKNVSYKISDKTKIKNLIIDGEVFGLKFKSEWKIDYNNPKSSTHNIHIFNPTLQIKNIYNYKNLKNFTTDTFISFEQDKMQYNLKFEKDNITISSPNENTNFNINSKIQLKPFYFDGGIKIKNKKVKNIIDNFLINLFIYDKKFIGNFNGNLKIYFDQLNNRFIKQGQIDFVISEKKILFKEAKFDLDKIGTIKTNIFFTKDRENIKFKSQNLLKINDHIEFAKTFQIGSKKIKNIKQITFDLEKNIGDEDFIITNVKVDNMKINDDLNQIFLIKNIQNLRSYIRKLVN